MAAQPMSGIYEIVNLVNGKRYVGSAVNIEQRWREHRSGLNRGKHHSRHLLAAWKKYGGTSFEFRILMQCPALNLLANEQAEFERRRPEYNICQNAGSTLGRLHSEETRRKIGQSKVGMKMPPRDDEYRAKISAAHKGRQKSSQHFEALQAGRRSFSRTEDQCKAVSDSLRRAYAEGRHRRDRSPEYREKIAATLRGRSLSEEHKAKVSAAMTGKKRGPYNLDPAKAEARREAARQGAAKTNERRWGFKAE